MLSSSMLLLSSSFFLVFIFYKCFPLARMTTKFNQGMYSRMMAKKNKPLSNPGAKTVRVMDKGASITLATPATPGTEMTRTASLATSVEEIIPLWNKRQRTGDTLKDKADSQSSSVWDNARVTLERVQEIFTTKEMKVFSGMSPNEVVGLHLHKLVQVVYLCNLF